MPATHQHTEKFSLILAFQRLSTGQNVRMEISSARKKYHKALLMNDFNSWHDPRIVQTVRIRKIYHGKQYLSWPLSANGVAK